MLYPWTMNFFNTFGKSWTLFLVFFRLLRNRFFPTRSKHEYSPNGFKQTHAEHEQFLQYLPTINLGISQNWWKLEIQKNQPRNTVSFTPFFFWVRVPSLILIGILSIFSAIFSTKKVSITGLGFPFEAMTFLPSSLILSLRGAMCLPWKLPETNCKSPWKLMVGRRKPLPFGFVCFFRRKNLPICEKPVHLHLPWKKSTKCRYIKIPYMDGMENIFSPAIPENIYWIQLFRT